MEIKVDERFKLGMSGSDRFDLIEVVERKKKDSEEKYKADNVIGYDMKIESCISSIINLKLKEKKEVTTLKEFLKEYKKEKENLTQQLNLF